MKPSLFARRAQFPLVVAALLAVALAIFSPAPQEALGSPDCKAFANTPKLVAGQIESNGGVTCTSSLTGAFRVDVTLYRDGSEVGRALNTCHGEQQCGALVVDTDVEGGQQWCAMTVGAYTSSGQDGARGAARTEMVCENAAF
jgi:hypothetical protein